MPDPYYPSVDFDFIKDHLIATGQIEDFFTVGSTTTFVLKGTKAIFKRTIYIRELWPGQVCYEQATGLAIKHKFIGSLMDWLEFNRRWKEGAYIQETQSAADEGE